MKIFIKKTMLNKKLSIYGKAVHGGYIANDQSISIKIKSIWNFNIDDLLFPVKYIPYISKRI